METGVTYSDYMWTQEENEEEEEEEEKKKKKDRQTDRQIFNWLKNNNTSPRHSEQSQVARKPWGQQCYSQPYINYYTKLLNSPCINIPIDSNLKK